MAGWLAGCLGLGKQYKELFLCIVLPYGWLAGWLAGCLGLGLGLGRSLHKVKQYKGWAICIVLPYGWLAGCLGLGLGLGSETSIK